MLKSILKLKGAQELSRNEQKSINGAAPGCQLMANGTYVCYKRCGYQWIVTTALCCVGPNPPC